MAMALGPGLSPWASCIVVARSPVSAATVRCSLTFLWIQRTDMEFLRQWADPFHMLVAGLSLVFVAAIVIGLLH